jgi:hypothetical protein
MTSPGFVLTSASNQRRCFSPLGAAAPDGIRSGRSARPSRLYAVRRGLFQPLVSARFSPQVRVVLHEFAQGLNSRESPKLSGVSPHLGELVEALGAAQRRQAFRSGDACRLGGRVRARPRRRDVAGSLGATQSADMNGATSQGPGPEAQGTGHGRGIDRRVHGCAKVPNLRAEFAPCDAFHLRALAELRRCPHASASSGERRALPVPLVRQNSGLKL